MSQAISSVEPSWRTTPFTLGRIDLCVEVPVGDEARTERTERVGALHAQHRAGVGVAKVVQAEVVGDGVAGDVVRRVGRA